MSVVRITTGVMGDTCGDLDPHEYARLLTEKLVAEYPGAEVHVLVDTSIMGSPPASRVELDTDDNPADDEIDVDNIAERVFADLCASHK